jgi:hypothetical protein
MVVYAGLHKLATKLSSVRPYLGIAAAACGPNVSSSLSELIGHATSLSGRPVNILLPWYTAGQRSSGARTMRRTEPRRLTPSEQRLAAALDPAVARRLIALRQRIARLALLPDVSQAMLGALAAEIRWIREQMDAALARAEARAEAAML